MVVHAHGGDVRTVHPFRPTRLAHSRSPTIVRRKHHGVSPHELVEGGIAE